MDCKPVIGKQKFFIHATLTGGALFFLPSAHAEIGFTPGCMVGAGHSEGVALADLNGNGWLAGSDSESAVAVDFNDDDHPDIFVANSAGHPNRLWLNDGAGHFIDSGLSLGDEDSKEVASADFDGDGRTDVLLANDGPNTLWLNVLDAAMVASEAH